MGDKLSPETHLRQFGHVGYRPFTKTNGNNIEMKEKWWKHEVNLVIRETVLTQILQNWI